MIEIKMPQWGMGMIDGTIVAWLVKPGDKIAAGDPLCEVEAAKATNVLESPVAGTLRQILVPLDETVDVQTTLALIEPD